MELNKLLTETRNSASMNLDTMSSREIVELMNKEDNKVIGAVQAQLELIAKAIDLIVEAIQQGGRLFYIGAGTSGRLGVLDASECPPTFSVSPDMVIGLIAGGDGALRTAVEGAEDSLTRAQEELSAYNFNCKDILVGLAASGRTPYVIGGLKYAQGLGCKTIAISCTNDAQISAYADIPIELLVGPEILTGSTRLKSGTAQKLVLNMLSTGTMVRLGKCYGNLMVDVQPTNEKLKTRAENIVMEVTGVSREIAKEVLQKTNGKVKPALVMLLKECSLDESLQALNSNNDRIADALKG